MAVGVYGSAHRGRGELLSDPHRILGFVIVAEHETFTLEQAEAFSALIRSELTRRGEWDRRVRDEWSPLQPYDRHYRNWGSLASARRLPFLVTPEPRLQVVLRICRFSIYVEELPELELESVLRDTKARIGRILNDRVWFNEAIAEGTLDQDDDFDLSRAERDLELRFGVQLLEV